LESYKVLGPLGPGTFFMRAIAMREKNPKFEL